MTNPVTIRKSSSIWSIRAGGAVLGESSYALELSEGKRQPVLYFPRGDIAMAFLEPTGTTSTDATKGEAGYFSIVLKSDTIVDAAWSYDAPAAGAERIAGYIAFDTEKVTVEET